VIGEVGEGNRKDVRNAVEAAHSALGWTESAAHNRAQILYFIAENLGIRSREFADRLVASTGCSNADADSEVEASIERLFTYAAWADKFEGPIHRPPLRGLALAIPEPIGVVAIVCPDESPLLSFVTLVSAAISMANTVVAVPSELHPLSSTDLYQVLETSDVSAGVVNIVTGARNSLAAVLAEHDDVDGIWYFGDAAGAEKVEYQSAGNMKRTWIHPKPRSWTSSWAGQSEEFLREATQVKNIWVPYGA
jgi:aldehyde dehydrogenase (NAD+)